MPHLAVDTDVLISATGPDGLTRTTIATLYAAMLPQTPTTTTRPARFPAIALIPPARGPGAGALPRRSAG